MADDPTMRVCFLDVNASYSHTSLALPVLHASCSHLEFLEWHVVRGTINDDPNRLATAVVEHRPDVLLATAFLFTREFQLKALRRVRAMLPHCRIILGGPEFLGDNEAFLRHESTVDAVVRGEGEACLASILKSLNDGDWPRAKGLCRLLAGQYLDGGHAVLEADAWAALPVPQTSRFAILDRPFIQLETTRGCPHRCSFCTSALPVAVRHLPVERVRESLDIARDHGVREIRVLDRTFNAQPKRALELMRLFRCEFPDLRFHLEIHPGHLTDKILVELADAPKGLYHLEVGLQSTSFDALDAVERGRTAEAACYGLYTLCMIPGLDIHVDLLAGLPNASMPQLLDDLKAVSRFKPAEIQLEILKILPGTPIEADTARFGIVHAPDTPYEVLATPGFTAADLQTVRKLSLLIDRYYNHPMLKPATQMALEELPGFYTDYLTHLEKTSDPFTPISLEKRALRLHRYLVDHHPLAAAQLEIDWIRTGLSPSSGPGQAVRCKPGIPDSARLIEGAQDCTDGHIWRMANELGTHWFVFDRAKRRQGPVAVFRQSSQTV